MKFPWGKNSSQMLISLVLQLTISSNVRKTNIYVWGGVLKKNRNVWEKFTIRLDPPC